MPPTVDRELPTVRVVLPSVRRSLGSRSLFREEELPRLPFLPALSLPVPLPSLSLLLDLALPRLLSPRLLLSRDAPLEPLVLFVDVFEPLLNIRLSVLLSALVNLIRLLNVISIPPSSGKSADLSDRMHIGRIHIRLLFSGSASRPFWPIPAELDLSRPSLPDMLVPVPKPPRVRFGLGMPELPGSLRNCTALQPGLTMFPLPFVLELIDRKLARTLCADALVGTHEEASENIGPPDLLARNDRQHGGRGMFRRRVAVDLAGLIGAR